jgi:hypothetical protein
MNEFQTDDDIKTVRAEYFVGFVIPCGASNNPRRTKEIVMKKISSIILAFIMLVSFTACGGKSSDGDSDAPHLGMWNAVAASMMDMTLDISEVYDEGASLEMKDSGKFKLVLDGEKAYGKFTYEDGLLNLSGDGLDLSGTIENDILTLTNMLDMGLDLIFEKEGSNAYANLPKTSGDTGYYVLDQATEDGETMTGDEFREMGFDYYVLLNEDGTAVCQTDDIATGTWDKGVMKLRSEGGDTANIEYEINGDELTIDWGGLIMIYVRSSGTPPTLIVSGETSGAGKLSELQEWWDGDWYGYWEPHSVTDDYNHLDEGRWDCYATIKMNPDNTGVIYLWEDGEDFATVDITLSEYGVGDKGAAMSESGHYWNGDEIGHADWIIDPGIYDYEDYMVIDGRYVDEDDEGFYYMVYLRPWGQLWEENPEDERPPWYEDWYLGCYSDPMTKAILDIDGYIHSELVDVLVAEKPAPPEGAAPEKPAPSAPPSGGPIKAEFEMEGVMISATLPAQGWCAEHTAFGYNLYQVESCDDIYSNSPRIRINIDPDKKKFDRYSNDFENVQTIKNRTIGGIDMAGRTYEFVGMDWIEYIGMLDSTLAVSVNTSKIDISSGEGSAVIDSIKFSMNKPVSDITGERISAGNVSALCPDGWKSYPVWDLWAEEANTVDKDKLKFNKGAVSEDDQHFTPSMEIRYYGLNSTFFRPDKDRFDDPEDLAPMKIGGRTWEGIAGLSWGNRQALIWTEDGDDEYLIAILLEYDGKKITLQDADVQAIIASITAP